MQLSRFVIIWQDSRTEDVLLYDVLTGKTARTDAAPAALLAGGYFVEDDLEDEAQRERKADGAFHATLLPSNALCFVHPGTGMLEEYGAGSAEDAVQRVMAAFDAGRSGRLTVHFFGDEPLDRREEVLHCAAALHAELRVRGGVFGWEITTKSTDAATFVEAMSRYGCGAARPLPTSQAPRTAEVSLTSPAHFGVSLVPEFWYGAA